MNLFERYRKQSSGIGINVVLLLVLYQFLPRISDFSKPYTPDSQFYLSLSIYADEVTSRAPWPAYFWTKTSLIAPAHFFSSIFGILNGFKFFQLFLLAILAISVGNFIYQKYQDNFIGLVITSVIVFNSVVITFLGGTYSTIIGIILLIIIQVEIVRFIDIKNTQSSKAIIGAILGGILSTLLFANPSYFIMGALLILAFVLWVVIFSREKFMNSLKMLGVLVLSFILSFYIWIQISSRLFPQRDWLDTVIFYAKILNPRDYTSPNQIAIFQSNPSLYFILGVQVVAFFVMFLGPKKVGAPLSVSTFFLTLSNSYFIYSTFIVGSNALEVDFYNALLWAPSLFFMGVYLAEILQISKGSFTLLLSLPLTYFAGVALSGITQKIFLQGLLLVSVAVGIFSLFKISYIRRNPRPIFIIPIVIIITFVPQILQGSNLYPYGIAYSSYDLKKYFVEFESAEKFIVDSSKPGDRVMVWVEPNTDLVTFASGQLWGPNSVTHDFVLSDFDKNNLNASQPTLIASYFVNNDSLIRLKASIASAGWNLGVDNCSKFRETEISAPFSICIFTIKGI
jgi:hypothetical protein